MIAARTIPALPRILTSRQRSIRRHSCGLPLNEAVRFAVDLCFGFNGRAMQGKALWSETEHVWLGSMTFLALGNLA